MAQTFGDFINELRLYEYSREHFELMKECSELDLMNQYLENQRVISAYTAEACTFTESYFQEAADDNSIMAIMEETETKKKNIFVRMWEGLKKILKKVAAFFRRIFGKEDSVSSASGSANNNTVPSKVSPAASVSKHYASGFNKLLSITVSKSDIDGFIDALDNVVKNANSKYKYIVLGDLGHITDRVRLTSRKNNKLDISEIKYADDVDDQSKRKFQKYLGLIYEDISLSLYITELPDPDACPAPLKDLISMCDDLIESKTESQLDNLIKFIAKSTANVKARHFYDIDLDRIVIWDICKKLEELARSLDTIHNIYHNDTSSSLNTAPIPKADVFNTHVDMSYVKMNKAYALICKTIAATMEAYTFYRNFSWDGIAELSKLVENHSKND